VRESLATCAMVRQQAAARQQTEDDLSDDLIQKAMEEASPPLHTPSAPMHLPTHLTRHASAAPTLYTRARSLAAPSLTSQLAHSRALANLANWLVLRHCRPHDGHPPPLHFRLRRWSGGTSSV
jgi:hypothetical protein